MKLLTVNMTLDPRTGGGTAARAVHVTRALADLGVDCAIAAAREGLDDVAGSLSGVSLVSLTTIGGRFRIPIAGRAALRRAAADADVILILNHWTSINVVGHRAAIEAHVPYAFAPAGALSATGRSHLLKRAYTAMAGRRIVRDAAACIAVTEDETGQFADYGIERDRVTVIPNAMRPLPAGDADRFRRGFSLGEAPLALFLGRLAPIKGPDLLVEAFAACAREFPVWHLVMAGPDDGQLTELKKATAMRGLDGRVHFVGFLPEAARADALAAVSLVVVPSRREAMSHVVLEAAAADRPVLITDRCGLPEVAASGGGWIVEATSAGIANGLRYALADPAALPDRGRRWARYAADRFSWSRIGPMYLDVLTRVVRGARGR